MPRKFPPHQLALAFILLVALLLRGCALDQRPMHADEANQAVKLGELLDSGNYWFDPHDHHGPTLYYFARPVAWLCLQTSLVDLTESAVRLTPALFGTLAVFFTALLAAPLGRVAMLVAAAFLAVAPPAVYFSRYFVQETLLLAFTLAALLCGREWLRSGRIPWALAMGACGGLMQATKALAPLFAIAALVALWIENGFRIPAPARWRGFTVALLAAAVVAAMFYSSFGQNPAGLRAALGTLGTMFDRATEGASGHEKPWWWYAALLTRSYSESPDWRTLPFLALGLAGYLSSWRGAQRGMRFFVVYATVVAGVLSLVPYKTPWVVIHLLPALALFAASIYELPLRWRRIGPAPLFVGALLAFFLLGAVAWFVSFTRPADERNPYAYVHSAPDVLKIRPLVDTARRAFPLEPIRIISPEYWPLPWYLRGVSGVGYHATPPEDCDGALVIVAAELAESVQGRLHGEYSMSYVGLRPGFVLVVFAKSAGSAP